MSDVLDARFRAKALRNGRAVHPLLRAHRARVRAAFVVSRGFGLPTFFSCFFSVFSPVFAVFVLDQVLLEGEVVLPTLSIKCFFCRFLSRIPHAHLFSLF